MIGFFSGLKAKTILYGVGALALAFVVWQGVQFVQEKIEAEQEIVRLEQRVESQKDAIRVLREAAEQKQDALDAADAAREQLEQYRESYDNIRGDVNTSTEADDGEVAPVLRRTLDSLDRLQ